MGNFLGVAFPKHGALGCFELTCSPTTCCKGGPVTGPHVGVLRSTSASRASQTSQTSHFFRHPSSFSLSISVTFRPSNMGKTQHCGMVRNQNDNSLVFFMAGHFDPTELRKSWKMIGLCISSTRF